MKVYNLACPLDHRFEGWFVSEEDCLAQQDRGMLACSICDSTEITRMPSAPHIAKSSSSKNVSTSTELTVASPATTDHSGVSGDVVALIGSDPFSIGGAGTSGLFKGYARANGAVERCRSFFC